MKIALNKLLAHEYNMFPLASVKEPDFFGVEVELEGNNIVDRNGLLNMYWAAHNDGSLRVRNLGDEAIEYVFRAPLSKAETEAALKMLCAFLNMPNRKVYESYRTSIHVHVNCLQETLGTILNYITIATILDELLVSQNGEHRIGNNFCLRMRDAEGVLRDLIGSLEAHGHIHGIHGNERYSSVNLASLTKFGTIEFRSLECTTDYDRIMHWVNTLQAMKEAARGYRDPTKVIEEFSMMGPERFLRKVLGPYADRYVNVPDLQRILYNGMRLAQDVAYVADWELKEELEKPKPKPRGKRNARIEEEWVAPARWAAPPRPNPMDVEEAILQHNAAVMRRVQVLRDNLLQEDPEFEPDFDDDFEPEAQEEPEEEHDDDPEF